MIQIITKPTVKYRVVIGVTLALMLLYYFIHDWIEKHAPWLFWVYLAISVALEGFPGIFIYVEKYMITGNIQLDIFINKRDFI